MFTWSKNFSHMNIKIIQMTKKIIQINRNISSNGQKIVALSIYNLTLSASKIINKKAINCKFFFWYKFFQQRQSMT